MECGTGSSPTLEINDTEPSNNGTIGKIPATREGLPLTYSSLVIVTFLLFISPEFLSLLSQKIRLIIKSGKISQKDSEGHHLPNAHNHTGPILSQHFINEDRCDASTRFSEKNC